MKLLVWYVLCSKHSCLASYFCSSESVNFGCSPVAPAGGPAPRFRDASPGTFFCSTATRSIYNYIALFFPVLHSANPHIPLGRSRSSLFQALVRTLSEKGAMPKNLSAKFALPYQSANKDRRKQFHIKQKKTRDALKREERFSRKKEEARDPRLREERLRQNVPQTIESKRTWDEVDGDDDGVLGKAVDLAQLAKKRKFQEAQELLDESDAGSEAGGQDEVPDAESDVDSMLEGGSDDDEDEDEEEDEESTFKKPTLPNKKRETSPNPSTTSTNLNLTPEALASKFPTLFAQPTNEPKILITTSINSTLHKQAEMLTEIFPNSVYVRRSSHRFGHKFSVKEIAGFAANRKYTTVIVLMEDMKKPCGMDFVHLPDGPMMHFSLTNWIDGRKLPGHGNATNHYPEVSLADS